jgi:hypothetical protein
VVRGDDDSHAALPEHALDAVFPGDELARGDEGLSVLLSVLGHEGTDDDTSFTPTSGARIRRENWGSGRPTVRSAYTLNIVMTFRARVKNGRLTLDEPTDLPEGAELELQPVPKHHPGFEEGLAQIEAWYEHLSAEERAAFEQDVAEAKALTPKT